ncbi:MAG: hypothetical protein U0930_13580 [Pirellulales bacterium]
MFCQLIKFVYMKSQKFDFEGVACRSGRTQVTQRNKPKFNEAMARSISLLRWDSWTIRGTTDPYWVHGQDFAGGHNGYYQAGKFAPSGQILVKSNGYVFGYGRKPSR